MRDYTRAAVVALTLLALAAGVAAAATDSLAKGQIPFSPLAASSPCTPGGNPAEPLVLPAGYTQRVIAKEGDGGTADLWDMNTLNENGPDAGRYLYRTHEVRAGSQVSVTDLWTGDTSIVAQRADWERFDGIAWTPWGTILAAEETTRSSLPDPDVPQARAGLVYEIDPATGASVALPAIGSRSHEGIRLDPQGNVYGISETSPGYVYKFVPDRRGDLTSGQLYALKVVAPTGDRTGDATWVPLDRAGVQVDSDAEAGAAGATAYGRPEDVELATSTGNNHGGANVLYVAITSEDRVLAVDLRQPAGGSGHGTAFVSDYVRAGVNAPADFESPDNLALDKNGTLYVTEDPGGNTASGKAFGDDIWAAFPAPGNPGVASKTVRFASINDCDAEPTGVYFDRDGGTLYVNVQHRGGDRVDLAMAIFREG